MKNVVKATTDNMSQTIEAIKITLEGLCRVIHTI